MSKREELLAQLEEAIDDANRALAASRELGAKYMRDVKARGSLRMTLEESEHAFRLSKKVTEARDVARKILEDLFQL